MTVHRMIPGRSYRTRPGRLPAIRAVRLSRNFGKELALCAGLERARGDAMC